MGNYSGEVFVENSVEKGEMIAFIAGSSGHYPPTKLTNTIASTALLLKLSISSAGKRGAVQSDT